MSEWESCFPIDMSKFNIPAQYFEMDFRKASASVASITQEYVVVGSSA